MLNAFIKLLVSKLNNLLLLVLSLVYITFNNKDNNLNLSQRHNTNVYCKPLSPNHYTTVALTGFVCTYKIQAEEECLSSNVLCYECDSRYDPNCADPFELSSLSLMDQLQAQMAAQASNNSLMTSNGSTVPSEDRQQQRVLTGSVNNSSNPKVYKKFPNASICHGCCVKITSKTPEGATYVKRTCTTNLQINYFMVGLVCMKESGDRGKMCFCETDYCNGVISDSSTNLITGLVVLILGLISSYRLVLPAATKLVGE